MYTDIEKKPQILIKLKCLEFKKNLNNTFLWLKIIYKVFR